MDCDLILLAGDIATKTNGLAWIRDFSDDTPTAYICGNHEFYGEKLPRLTSRLIEETEGSNIHVLEDSSFSVDGWHVYGCTLWTDLALQGDWQSGAAVAGEYMNDYKRIRNSARGYRKLSPRDARAIHLLSLARMATFLSEHDPRRTIVMTHHAPSVLSLPERRRDNAISCAYASRLDDFITEHQPYLWVHGHIHHGVDYRIGDTRVISNPQAYPDEENEHFDPALILELP